jgi:photosystem II oxygen-evolving enhancer protein 1
MSLNCTYAESSALKKAMGQVVAGILAVSSLNEPVNAMSKAEVLQLSYDQVKGSGLANRCSEVKGEGVINLSPGKVYKVTDLCVEPTSWQVMDRAFRAS